MPIATSPSPDCAPPSPHPLEVLEMRRLRGLREVRELQDLRARRPLLGFEERSLRRSQSLVKEMDEQIRTLLSAPDTTPGAQAHRAFDAQARPRRPVESGTVVLSRAFKS